MAAMASKSPSTAASIPMVMTNVFSELAAVLVWSSLRTADGHDVDPVDLFRFVLQTRLDAAYQ